LTQTVTHTTRGADGGIGAEMLKDQMGFARAYEETVDFLLGNGYNNFIKYPCLPLVNKVSAYQSV